MEKFFMCVFALCQTSLGFFFVKKQNVKQIVCGEILLKMPWVEMHH